MKSIFAVLVLLVAFTTGFTCSKNTPPPTTEEVPAQATPATEVPPVDGAAQPPPAGDAPAETK